MRQDGYRVTLPRHWPLECAVCHGAIRDEATPIGTHVFVWLRPNPQGRNLIAVHDAEPCSSAPVGDTPSPGEPTTVTPSGLCTFREDCPAPSAEHLRLCPAPGNTRPRSPYAGTLADPAVVRADEALDRAPLLVECQGLPGCTGTNHDVLCTVTL